MTISSPSSSSLSSHRQLNHYYDPGNISKEGLPWKYKKELDDSRDEGILWKKEEENMGEV